MKIRKAAVFPFIAIIIAFLALCPFANLSGKQISFHNFYRLSGIVVTKEPYRHYRYMITNKKALRQIAWNMKFMEKVNTVHFSNTYRLLFVFSDGTGKEFTYLPNQYLCDLSTQETLRPSPSLQKVLNRELRRLKRQVNTCYGELIPWTEVKELLPPKAFLTVIDFDTDLRFLVQCRAGSSHADVQPLTAYDTAIMKKIYGGKWSWKRRAVIIEINGLKIAGSMNGMPHGAGAIQSNDFPGHFCIHFWGSKLHKSNRVDKAHQRMILKAAGLL